MTHICKNSARWQRVAPRVVGVIALLVALANINFGQDLERLRRAVESGTSEEKRSALFDLRNLRSPAGSKAAIPALTDADPIVRATATASVVFAPREEAIAELIPLLSDKEPFVRKEAAYALAKVGGAEVAAPLLRDLDSEKDAEVRASIAAALGFSGSPTAIPALVSILDGKPSEGTEFLRRCAARSIGQIAQFDADGNNRVVTPESFLPEKYKEQAKADPPTWRAQAVQSLIRTLENSAEAEDTRREAAFALGAIGDPVTAGALKQHLASVDPFLSEICREALLRIP